MNKEAPFSSGVSGGKTSAFDSLLEQETNPIRIMEKK
jgi:hypothetical protein